MFQIRRPVPPTLHPCALNSDLSEGGGRVRNTATWCALCTTMLLSTALIFFIVKNTSKAWDYATTIAFVHGVASMLGETRA